MRVLHLDSIETLPDDLQHRLKRHGEYIPNIEANIPRDKYEELIGNVEVLILAPSAIKPFDASWMEKANRLKHVAIVTSGLDWIDVGAARARGISVSRPVGANAQAVAEHTVGMMIDLAKRISEFDRDIRDKGAYDFRNYMGIELFGKTLGIIGLGNVGHRVVRIARGFEMKVLAYDRSEESTDEYKVVGLDELLAKSDYISVNIPLSDETKDLINKDAVNKLKDGVIIVNTAREEIVNKPAVIKGLRSGKIRGYGIETNIMQPVEKSDGYIQFPNVIVNAHNAFNTVETQRRVSEMVVDNVISFIQGKPENIL